MEYSDFCKPNPVMLCGCDSFFTSVVPHLMHLKINIVGVIDINKNGTVNINHIEIPIYNINDTINKFGKDLNIIITLNNVLAIEEVKNNLIKCGFNKNKIFDINQIKYITVSSEKSFCPFLGKNIIVYDEFIYMCCIISTNNFFNSITHFFMEGEEVTKTVNILLDKYQFYRESSLKGRIPLFCIDCPLLSDDKSIYSDTINGLTFSDHSYCNADCVYCADGISNHRKSNILNDYKKRCKIFHKIMLEIKHRKLFNEKMLLELIGGEITCNPGKKLLYGMAKDIPTNPVLIVTNGIIYDEEISNIVSINPNARIMCDVDAGTRITYIKVKGVDKFNVVRDNLKKYASFGKITLKYIIKPGFNDTDDDVLGTVDLLKFLNISMLIISPDVHDISLASNKKSIRRTIIISVAKFKIIMEQNGLQCIIEESFWQKQYIIEINRMVNALKSAGYTIKSNQF